MRALPWRENELLSLNLSSIRMILEIIQRRNWIRKHRDQKGDDRCWVDDYWFYPFLIDSPPVPKHLPPFEEMMSNCQDFFVWRKEENIDPLPIVQNFPRWKWDLNLLFFTNQELFQFLFEIQVYTKEFLGIDNRPKTCRDCRKLYSILPESSSVQLDFRLPPIGEFLGYEKAPIAGCPSFHKSHDHCTTCNIHAWGPCNKKTRA